MRELCPEECATLNKRPNATDAYSGYSEFRRVRSAFVDLEPFERFRNFVVGGFAASAATFGLIATFLVTTGIFNGRASGAYLAGSILGALINTAALGTIWYAGLSMAFRSQKLRGYGGVDVSSDIALLAAAVLVVGICVSVFTGILAVLGDALNPNASRLIPIALFGGSLLLTAISGIYLKWRSHRLASRYDADDETDDDDDD